MPSCASKKNTIVVTNAGPSTATNVAVSDPRPTGLTSLPWSVNGTSNQSGALSATIASLPPATLFPYTTLFRSSASATGSLANTVTVTAANDTNAANNSATDTDTLTPQADLAITKVDNVGGSSITGSTGTVTEGATVTYTIVVSNSGPTNVTGASVKDTLPVSF